MTGPSRAFLLALLAPLYFGCAQGNESVPVAQVTIPAAEIVRPALPMTEDAAAQARLAQQYVNALATQLAIEREQRRHDLAEQKRHAQLAQRILEIQRPTAAQRSEIARRNKQTRLDKEARRQDEAAISPRQKPARQATAMLAPTAPADKPVEVPVFQAPNEIQLPQATGGGRRKTEPVLFDPETRGGS